MGYKINKKKFIEAAKDSLGIVSLISKRLGVTRDAVYKYLKKNPKLEDILDDERERGLDNAEVVLMNLVKNKDFRAVKFLLSTKGKHRGYIEKRELEIEDGPKKTKSIKDEFEEFKKLVEDKK